MLAPKRLRRPVSSTTDFCFNKPLFRPLNYGLSNGSLNHQTSRSFVTASHRAFPFSCFAHGSKPRRPHVNSNHRTSSTGNTSARRTPWENTQGRSRPTLETKAFGPVLANVGFCDSRCATIVDASISMLSSVRITRFGSSAAPSTHELLQARKNANWTRLEDSYLYHTNGGGLGSQQQRREFHSSSSRAALPVLLKLAALLKVGRCFSFSAKHHHLLTSNSLAGLSQPYRSSVELH